VGNYVPKDRGYKAAQQAGYRSRAALKLVEIDRKFRLLRTGMRVMDLGCWPGGWLQVASASVGPTGLVVGIEGQLPDGGNILLPLLIGIQGGEIVLCKMLQQGVDPIRVVEFAGVDGCQHITGHQRIAVEEDRPAVSAGLPLFGLSVHAL